jgi:hypothetical protein
MIINHFNKIIVEENEIKFLVLPEEKSHCCGLKVQGRMLMNTPSYASLSLLSPKLPLNTVNEPSKNFNLDGLLHYAPYKMVIYSSGRYFETLAVAQQAQKKSSSYQAPIFHSVLPHAYAVAYENMHISPMGVLADIIDADESFNVSFQCPMDSKNTLCLVVRRVRVMRDAEFQDIAFRGSCPLIDPYYFVSCAAILDKHWEDADVANGFDVCLITGNPGANDKGKNEILLAGRVYCDFLSIPVYSDCDLNNFLNACIDSLPKNGYEVIAANYFNLHQLKKSSDTASLFYRFDDEEEVGVILYLIRTSLHS